MSSQDSADGRHTDTLKTILALHAIALDGMAEGLCVLDSELRVVLFNRKLTEMLDLPRGSVQIGAPLKAILALVTERVSEGSQQGGEMWRDLANMFSRREAFHADRRTANGAHARLHFQPFTGGGWVATCALAKEQASEREAPLDAWRRIFVNSSRGVCMFDADKRLVLYNDRYLELFGFNSDQVRPGMSYRDVLALASQIGIHPEITAERLGAMQCSAFAREPTTQQLGLCDGRTIAVAVRSEERV